MADTIKNKLDKQSPRFQYANHILNKLKDKPLYQLDEYLESEVNKFVVTHIVPNLFSEYETCDMEILQKGGVDAVATEHGSVEYDFVDIKSANRYIDGSLKTFVLELGYTTEKASNPIIGWYLRDGIITSHYLLIWPKANAFGTIEKTYQNQKTRVYSVFGYDEIEYVDFVLVKKTVIQNYLDSIGLNKSNLLSILQECRTKDGAAEEINNQIKDSGVSIDCSSIETLPINLKIDKNKYIELAIKSGRVYNRCPGTICDIPVK